MANGSVFLCRRSVLAQVGGYNSARSSFDDVTWARNVAALGSSFLDGAKVLKVRMYEGPNVERVGAITGPQGRLS